MNILEFIKVFSIILISSLIISTLLVLLIYKKKGETK